MSAKIDLKDLSSFFELFVGFTFAFTSLQTFKDAINKASVKDLDDRAIEYSEKCKIEIEKTKDIAIINESSSDLKGLILGRVDDLNKSSERILNLSRVTNIFYSGDFLKPLFYLTGAIYLFLILLSVFQQLIGDLSVFFIILFITLSVVAFYAHYYWTKIRYYKKLQFDKITWQFKTKRTLKRFGWVTFAICVTSFLISKVIHNGYPKVHDEYESIICSYLYITKKDFLQFASVICIISLAVVPFFIYYYREKLILINVQNEMESSFKQFDTILKEIQVISSAMPNTYLDELAKRIESIPTEPILIKPITNKKQMTTKKGATGSKKSRAKM